MTAKHAIAILDTIPDLFAQMGTGAALGLQIKEIVRRLHRVRSFVPWSYDKARASNKIRARASAYAMHYQLDDIYSASHSGNAERLEELRAAFLELRSHVLLDVAIEAAS